MSPCGTEALEFSAAVVGGAAAVTPDVGDSAAPEARSTDEGVVFSLCVLLFCSLAVYQLMRLQRGLAASVGLLTGCGYSR